LFWFAIIGYEPVVVAEKKVKKKKKKKIDEKKEEMKIEEVSFRNEDQIQ
jgi:predicted membrane protein